MQRKTMIEVYKTTQKLSNKCPKMEPSRHRETRVQRSVRARARIIHECRRETLETETRGSFSQARPTQVS
ncbi:conserved hypothetical protein [Nitrospira defluvii]|uniref:Uncharacterized protein n=1 Tax=Nitrospira defluvii TaxID=330214 RepID=A0ABM8QHL8_9BACT|nr:conserved hypothetical protein [Nitrospira defluvii]